MATGSEGATADAPHMFTRLLRAAWLVVVFAALFAPAAHLAFAPISEHSAMEQRRLATGIGARPRWANTEAFRAEVDRFLRDQFTLRATMIELRTRAALAAGISPTRSVFFGRNGWLFGDLDDTVSDMRGRGGLTDLAAAVLAARLALLVETLEAKGLPVVVTVAPNKSTIYPHYLPRWLRRVDDARTDYGRFRRQVARHPPLARTFVDLTDPLRRSGSTGALYRPHDTHWNARGAYVGYAVIARRLSGHLPDFRPTRHDSLRFVAARVVGDLAKMMDPYAKKREQPDIGFVSQPPRPRIAARVEAVPPATRPAQIFERRVIPAGATPRTLLVVGDSFSMSMVGYFLLGFDRVVFVHHDFGAWPRAAVARFKPKAVVVQIVERALANYVRRP